MSSHAVFIAVAYAATAAVLLAMVAAVVLEGRALRRALTRFEAGRDGGAGS